jgi:SSS family solute:Na+ symporter
MLPEAFTVLGMTLPITLMGAIIVIAVITGIYITFGGQTAVIFTDLLQGFILLFAGLLLFFFGITYLGGFDMFWNLLPTEWKLPMADFNQPANFNFVGIFWQDAIAGSIGFLFMNQGLIMRFMACKNVNEGRKAAAVNILFVLPISAIVVGNAGWIGKAISVVSPDIVSPSVSPDQIFVVVANIIASPGMFGFIMAALTAALMSTVDTLINATAAIFINDVYRPVQQFVKRNVMTDRDKKELRAARYASIGVTALGVLAVLAFKNFPTVYEAHGYFHSTLTPPLVVGIFLGVFWKRFTPAAVITTFVGGVALMILGARYPGLLIAPFDHGIEMDPDHPYSYIRALYNTLVCMGAAVLVTITTQWQRNICSMIRENQNQKLIMRILVTVILLVYSVVLFNILGLTVQIASAIGVLILVPITVTYYVKYDEKVNTNGLTAGSINIARNLFKGGEPNDQEGETVFVQLKQVDGEDSVVQFSTKDMAIMKAEIGDLVYISDKRKWMGGLKSIHAVFGQPHDEEGMVYITPDQIKHGMFVDGKMLEAEKEM